MKNARFERMARIQRDYHRHHPWRLSKGGLFIPHSYAETAPDDLSWWDDVGFILNGRRVIVWWRHPRYVYQDGLDEQAWALAGDDPGDDWLFEGATKNYRLVGRLRKKVVSYTSRQPSEAQQQYYDRHRQVREELVAEGVDFQVQASFKRERLWWATGVDLVAPMEIRNERELADMAALAKRLLLGNTTLGVEFPGYCYGRENWLSEQVKSPEPGAV